MKAIHPALNAAGLASLALLWLAGLYLRLPILVAPPLAPAIAGELGLNQAQVGALTTIPVLMLALGALPGAFAITRFGAVATVAGSLVLLTLASAARALAPPLAALFAATVVMGFAIAVMQPALPVLVKRWCPSFLALGSAVYMNGLLMGEFVGAGLTLPWVMPWLDGSWRGTLVFWSLPALAVAVLVALRGRADGARASTGTLADAGFTPLWRQARVWKLGLLLSASSAGFFGTNAYLGSVLAERGEEALLGSVLLYFNASQVAGSLMMVAFGRLLVGRHWPVLLVAWILPLCLLVSALSTGLVFMLAVVLVGLSTCLQLILIVSLVPMVASEHEAGPLAAGMYTVGYLLGFLVPMAGGALADVTGTARMALLPIGVLAAVAGVVALAPGLGHGASPSAHQPRRR